MGTEKETESEKGSMAPTYGEARRKQVRDEWMTELRGSKKIEEERDESMDESRCQIGKGGVGVEEIQNEMEGRKVQGNPRKSYESQQVKQFADGS